MKLKEALDVLAIHEHPVGTREWYDYTDKYGKTPYEIMEEAAKDFQTIIEAREKATQGEWRYTDHNWHQSSIYGGDKYLCTFDLDCDEVNEENQGEHEDRQDRDLNFITTAANITSKYIGGE